MLNLADRGFFSMRRWIRISSTGAHLAWRIKNSEIGPIQDHQNRARRLLSWSRCTNQMACAPGRGRKQATRARNGSRVALPVWSPSPSPRAPAAAERRAVPASRTAGRGH